MDILARVLREYDRERERGVSEYNARIAAIVRVSRQASVTVPRVETALTAALAARHTGDPIL